MTEVNHKKYEGIRFDREDESAIMTSILETIDYQYEGERTEVTIPTNEFTSVCPWSGLPDFADIEITYIPNKKLIEMKSLKYYLTSFRNVGIYQEHATQRILRDLVSLCEPLEMTITAHWNARGGLGTKTVARYSTDKEGERN